MKSMKLIMENFNKFLAEAENEGGEKPVIKYKIYGDPFNSAEYEYEFFFDEDKVKKKHKIDPETDESPIQLKNMVKELSDEGKLELKFAIDFDELRDNVAPTLKKSLKDGTTLKKVIDRWAELHGYKIEHPASANGSEESEEDEA